MRQQRTGSVLIAGLAAVTLIATACAPTGTPSTSASVAPSEQPVAGGRLVFGAIGDPKTMQPVISGDTSSSLIWQQVYLTLTRANYKTGQTEPNLAEKFELSSDGLTLTYTLRDNLVWSNGDPFTGEDWKYTVEAVARSAKTVRKSTYQDIVGWKDYVDGKTDSVAGIAVKDNGKVIEVKFTKIFCPAVAALGAGGAGGILPSKPFKAQWDNKTTDIAKNIDGVPFNMNPPASMGPWVFKEFKPGVQVTFTKNEKYFRGAPLLDELIVKVYADSTAVKNALMVGEVTQANVNPSDNEEVSKNEALKLFRYKQSTYDYIGWNAKAAKAPWLANVQVRQALAYGIDAPAIVNKVLFGFGSQIYAHTPPVSWAYDDTGFTKYSRDINKAKQLIEQAGAKMGSDGIYRWTDGSPMKMRIETDQGNNVRETILQFAQEQYKAIGIQIDPLLESFNALLDRTQPGTDYDGFIIGWSLGADPDPYSIWHSSQSGKDQFNDVFYANPTVDKALVDNRNGPDCSQAARRKALHTVDVQLNQDVPYTFLFTRDALRYADKKLQGFDPNTYAYLWNVEKWWLKK
jgi:peptide/nickel transport system substrate-binding protein